ncbi:Respiratory burst oxidase D [Grifola frondosa]|uniref:ferric-chelate reductase (NADPH) n=1 Tax=Grifola frondosa TaxID=5627 RepID=A0A1C7MJE6_GRIFR|nr:Respiratory burst oxidase D [Grifola frondosa]
MAYTYAWQYEKFRFAWAAFAVMTLIFICSISPFRRDHYEAFWFLHVLFVPLTLIMAAMHHPPLWWWCWAALGLWVGERAWRLTWWLHANGFTGGMLPSARHNQAQLASMQVPGKIDASQTNYFSDPKLVGKGSPAMSSSQSLGLTHYPPPPNSALILGFRTPYAPPPGFAHAELLPGRTVRLRLITPGYLPWAPGQHFLISIPSISRCTTHPFTAASICDEQAPGDDGRAIVFLIRAKNGWTRDLWDTVAQMISRGQNTVPSENLPVNYPRPGRGVLLRTCVDGPFGSSARADWGAYSTVVIVAGGSGVSFALSVLEYMCLCLAGRDGKYLGGRPGGFGTAGFKTTRVRFVWLVREFGHIQWCASTLRRCMSMIPSPELHVDIFVTNVKLPIDTLPSASSIPTPSQSTVDGLVPPTPEFALEGQPLHTGNRRHTRTPSADSVDSDGDSDVDLSYYTSDFVQPEGELGHEESILDLTNYEGDNDTGMPGEEQFSLSIRREGRTRRANTRRASMAMFAKREPDHRLSEPPSQAPDLSSLHLVGGHTSLPPLRINHTHAPATGSKLALQLDVDDMTPVDLSPMQTPNSAIPLLDNNLHHSSGLQSPIARPSPRMRAGMAELSPQLETSPSTTASTMTRPQSMMSGWSETNSLAALMQRGELDIHEQLKLDLDEQELQDVGIIAEVARPGKPKLERTLAAEIERAKGAIIVGCCGPTSLDALMRKTIAAQIDPARVARGDMRGSIALVSEDFAY